MRSKTKKATFNLHTDVPATLDQIGIQGMAASRNTPVEQALNQELNIVTISKQRQRGLLSYLDDA